MTYATGTTLSVNIGRVVEFDYHGRLATSAIWKQPVSGRLRARGVNLEGDEQADRRVHGGPDKAVYAYAEEDHQWWQSQTGQAIVHGAFGENLTTRGIDVTHAVVGEQWRLGSTRLEVSEPRVPCWKLAFRMANPRFIRFFASSGRPGTYLRIVEEGELGAGDTIEVVSRPDHGLTVGEIFRIFTRRPEQAGQLLAASQISESWRAWAQARV